MGMGTLVTIEVVGHYLAKEPLPLGIEATLLIGATIASCFATYEIGRRVRPLQRDRGRPGLQAHHQVLTALPFRHVLPVQQLFVLRTLRAPPSMCFLDL